MKSMNVNFERPGQFDDPNAVSTNICNDIYHLYYSVFEC